MMKSSASYNGPLGSSRNLRNKRLAVLFCLIVSIPSLYAVLHFVNDGVDLHDLFQAIGIQIVIGLVTIAALGWCLLPQLSEAWIKNPFGAALLSVLTFLIGSLAGCASSMFVYFDFNPIDYVVTPMYWLGLIGTIPAGLIGFVGSGFYWILQSSKS